MEDCIFCKIIRKEIPCHEIYEDKDVLVFLDIKPISKGHCLIVTKKHYKTLLDIPDKEGRYQIKDIPPGIYDLRMWYKAKISPAQTITVEKGKETVVDFR